MYLGMDGGGTKTAFVLLDRNGTIRATHQAGSAFYLETGMEALRTLIQEGIRIVLRTAGITATELDYAFFGLPVHGEDDRTAELDQLPELVLGGGRYACGNDMVCGWAGSLACQDGINVVAGTGSICYGEYDGRSARCGGWGELFSDEGSAYWIALGGLNLFTRMSDGRAERGPLYELVRERLGGRRDIELAAWVQSQASLGRSHMAALARLVHRAAELGDAQAAGIFARAAQELAQLVEATRQALAHPRPADRCGFLFRRRVWNRRPGDRTLRERAACRRLALRSGHAALCTRHRRGALRRSALRPAFKSGGDGAALGSSGRPAASGLKPATFSGRTIPSAGPCRASCRWPCTRSAPRSRLRGHRAFRPSRRTE